MQIKQEKRFFAFCPSTNLKNQSTILPTQNLSTWKRTKKLFIHRGGKIKRNYNATYLADLTQGKISES